LFLLSLALFREAKMPQMFGAGLFEKILVTLGLIAGVLIIAALLRGVAQLLLGGESGDRPRFWIAQAVRLLTLATVILIVVRVWLTGTQEFTAVMGWVAAGLAISLQRVVTAFAGYLIILRGKVFTVGDRITIGGVRGDVIALGFMQTTVMEMGQSPPEQADAPSMWIHGRQYSGRIVRVTNDKVFDTPVYNYTRDFRYMWEEMRIPIRYADDYRKVEPMLLDVARRHTSDLAAEMREALGRLRGKYFLGEVPEVEPRVYVRLTDNWTELSLRFVVRPTEARVVKDAMSRDILAGLNDAKIGIASGTYAIVEFPEIKVEQAAPSTSVNSH
jgi:small-conductance mechanosensitive channel